MKCNWDYQDHHHHQHHHNHQRRAHLLRDDGGEDVKAGIVQIKSTIRFCLSNMNRIGKGGGYSFLWLYKWRGQCFACRTRGTRRRLGMASTLRRRTSGPTAPGLRTSTSVSLSFDLLQTKNCHATPLNSAISFHFCFLLHHFCHLDHHCFFSTPDKLTLSSYFTLLFLQFHSHFLIIFSAPLDKLTLSPSLTFTFHNLTFTFLSSFWLFSAPPDKLTMTSYLNFTFHNITLTLLSSFRLIQHLQTS